MANRLSDATSPYLLQHAGNPVDWWPWCDDAFERARRRDVPVLLSVGYAACHWCHVMAHESFEDEQTAALVNDHLVAVKVDREERPDVDAVYMTATQAMTGQGGWPMTVLMTPGKEPFWCGTYLSRQQFRQLVVAAAEAWRDRRDDVTQQGRRVTAALAENSAATARAWHGDQGAAGAPVAADGADAELREVTDAAAAALGRDFDVARGGFGGAPKFPPSMVCEFLLRHHARTRNADALAMAERTMDAMARGGMYDQLGGGFARYSVDADWVVPHFEKMLYDNALLARAYTHLWCATGAAWARRVAEETCDFIVDELGTTEGGFAASLDADSENDLGESAEGAFYVWTPAQLRAVLGESDAVFAAEAFCVTRTGTFEAGSSVLQRRAESADVARFDRIRGALRLARWERARPGRDDKVVAAWNGLAVAALAEAGLLLRRDDLVGAAGGAAALLADVHLDGARLARSSRAGVAGASGGLLEDYACVADGLLALFGVTGEDRWVQVARALLEAVAVRFFDETGRSYDTAADAEPLLFRPADPTDNVTPSGAFGVAGALLGYGALTGSAAHRDRARVALRPLPALAGRAPRFAGHGLAVAEAMLAGPAEVAVVGPANDPHTRDLHRTALCAGSPGVVVAVGDGQRANVPLLEGRRPVGGAPSAYVCRNFTCRAPVTDAAALRDALASH